jgi:meckelin
VWLVAVFGQWFLRYAFYDRFYENKLLQFVDMISLANISMFVMDYSYHGYYVHGRSVHPHADTDMKEMKKNLQKEAVIFAIFHGC